MKKLIKPIGDLLSLLAMAPLAAGYFALAAVAGRERVFPGLSQFAALWPGAMGVFLRRALYRWVLPECGAHSHIGFGALISHCTARIGSRVYVGSYCMLGDVTLEPDVLVGSHVSIINGNRQHGIERLDIPVREQPGEYPRVTIGADSWLGDRSLVMASVGKHCVVGAGSVVTKPVPDYAIVVGNPARIIATRGRDTFNGAAVGGLEQAQSPEDALRSQSILNGRERL
jgi:acetyltransferase-like isoleucine patch superfamily enzyme